MKKKRSRIFIALLLVCLVSAPFASAQYTDGITVLGGLGGISRDALEEMLDLVACKCTGGGGCECGSGGGACTCITNNDIYPVGSIYMTVSPPDTHDPNDLFGGQWVRWGEGRVPLGVGASYTDQDSNTVNIDTAGLTGGAYIHTLTEAQLPWHTHTQNEHGHTQSPHTHAFTNGGSALVLYADSGLAYSDGLTMGNQTGYWYNSTKNTSGLVSQQPAIQGTTATNQYTGGDGAHNNMPPYVTCYMWKRTQLNPNPSECACGGGGSGTGGSCDCEPYTATLPISITGNDISIDLSDYVTTASLSTTLGSYVTSASLSTTLGSYVTSTSLATTLGSYVTSTGLTTALADYVTFAALNSTCNSYQYNSGALVATASSVYSALNQFRTVATAPNVAIGPNTTRFYRCNITLQLTPGSGSTTYGTIDSICFYDANTIYATCNIMAGAAARWKLKSTASNLWLRYPGNGGHDDHTTGTNYVTVSGWVDRNSYYSNFSNVVW